MLKRLLDKIFASREIEDLTSVNSGGSVSLSKGAVPEEPVPYKSFKVAGAREELEFRKTYSGIVGDGIHLEITFKNNSFSWGPRRDISGSMKQQGRGTVYFDPESIAEKVIIPEIVSAVQAFVAYAKKLDDEFMDSSPNFIDKDGNVWVRRTKENEGKE